MYCNMMYDLIHGEPDQEGHPRQALLLRSPVQAGRRKPKIVWQKYLGRPQDIIDAVTGPAAPGAPAQPKEADVSDFGAVAALYDLATRLRIVEFIDRHVSKRGGGPTVGTYLLVAAINRCVAAVQQGEHR